MTIKVTKRGVSTVYTTHGKLVYEVPLTINFPKGTVVRLVKLGDKTQGTVGCSTSDTF